MKSKKFFLIAFLFLILTAAMTLAALFFDVQPIGPEGTEVGFAALNGKLAASLPFNELLYKVTKYLGYLAILVVGLIALIGLIQWITRKKLFKVDAEILMAGVLYLVMFALYVFFEKFALNLRPMIVPGETELEASFPSTHTLLGCVVFGSAMLLSGKLLKNKGLKVLFGIGFAVLALATGIGRLFSGVHWFTDIIAGFLYSATLLSFYKAFVVLINEREEAKLAVPDVEDAPEETAE